MTKAIKRVMSVFIVLSIVVCAAGVSASALEMTADYDAELATIMATNYNTSISFAFENNLPTNYDVISAGKMGGMYGTGFNERYHYLKIDGGKELDIVSKLGFDVTNGFTFHYDTFTNYPSTGYTEMSIGKLKVVTDYATATMYLKFGDKILGTHATGYEPGTIEFQSHYLMNEYDIVNIDRKISVKRNFDGIVDSSAVKNDDPVITWTLPDGSTAKYIDIPTDADFAYVNVGFRASSEITSSQYGQIPANFACNFNGNFPTFARPHLSSNCGFSSLTAFATFSEHLTDGLNSFDIEYARSVYNSIKSNGSAGMVSAIAPINDYIIAAEKALIAGVTSDYDIKATAGGKIYCGNELFVNDSKNNPIELGKHMSFTAVADNGFTFSHWADINGNIVSCDATLNIIMNFTSKYTAVFTANNAELGDDITVMFRDYSENIVSVINTQAGQEITMPRLPFAYGYTCQGWMVDGVLYGAGEKVTFVSDTVIEAAVEKNKTTYRIVSVGAVDEIDNTYTYNTPITVKFNNKLLATGEKFAGWMSGDDIISFDEEYTFFVGAEATITAVISTKDAEIVPITLVTNVSLIENDSVASFLIERSMPDGYEYVESGAIYTNDATNASKLKLAGVNGTTVRKMISKFQSANGQMRVNIGSTAGGSTFCLVSYLTYRDADGSLTTIYSPIYSATTTAAAV